jgi:hypothetical protein
MLHRFALFAATFILGIPLQAEESLSLIEADNAAKVWSFNNGAEFPGAKGSLSLDPNARREGKESLRLVGDFTGGGGYVQAGRDIKDVDVRDLSMWVKCPESDHFTLRINDASGQTHQFDLKTETSPDWQKIDLPLERFFERRGQADAVTGISRYEVWGGAKDGNWHGPGKAIYLLLGNDGANKVRTLWFNDITIASPPKPVAMMESLMPIGALDDWGFSNGAEFAGATGSLTSEDGKDLKLAGDFTEGGAYVAAVRNLETLPTKEAPEVRLRLKTSNAKAVTVQLVDGSGQTHQRRGFPVTADGEWHEVVLRPDEIAGGEHWGGANDGAWHGGVRQMVVSVTGDSDVKSKRPEILMGDIRAVVRVPVFARAASFTADFEDGMLEGWDITKGVQVDNGSLAIVRALEVVVEPRSAAAPEFAARAGRWEVRLRCRPDLYSPDNSYRGVVQLECLDRNGMVIERVPVADAFGKKDWQEVKTIVDFPEGISTARFQIQLDKTYGEFWVDDIKASYLAPMLRRDDRISRLLFSTARLGNLLFPEDSRKIGVTVEAGKELGRNQMSLSYVVRDYWGSEHTPIGTTLLKSAEGQAGQFVYEGTIDLGAAPLEIGRYYELHASIPGSNVQTEPFGNHTSFAILPEAVTRKYRPEEIPFTSRNWDNRLSEYIRLTDRLGIRICGLWGSWSDEPPYKPEAPGLDLCRELGMGWLSNTPVAAIERGETKYSETALREGVRNLLRAHGDHRPLVINLGNEPHGTGNAVLRNVAAYKVVYEEVKKIAPDVPVVATSVEPNEEYFKAGYGKWCDAFDFHIYETAPNVRRTMMEYGELMRKYDVVKPLWSTELGLNSQGQPRHTVAVEVFKKLSSFFAAGGRNVSWFGLLYPDGDGKSSGSSSDSHNVFDCRFNRYCPRLDAVAYYNIVNAIAIKKFVEEKTYDGGTRSLLFQDREGQSLQVIWNEKREEDVFLPLAGVGEVKVVRIDGRRSTLDAAGEGISLRITDDPMLVLYGGKASLAVNLEPSEVMLTSLPAELKRGERMEGKLIGRNVEIIVPPFWEVDQAANKFTVTAPKESAARELEIVVKMEGARGELVYRLPVKE